MTETTTATGAKPGAEDLFEIFYAPSAVFERRRGGQYGLPLIGLAVISLVLLIATKGLMQPVFDVEMANSLAKSAAKMTPEQLEATKNATASFAGWGTLVGVPIAYLVTPFILGAIAWLVAKAVGVKQTYAVAVMIATFAYYPRLIEWVVSAVQMALMPNVELTSRLSLSLGFGRFLDGAHPNATTALLGRVDLFTLWVTFLIGLGFMVTAKATKAQATLIAGIVWLAGAVLPLWAALR